MSKYSFLLAILFAGSALIAGANPTRVWDGKRMALSHEDKGSIGVELRFYNEQELAPEKMKQKLIKEGFVKTAPHDFLQGWKKTDIFGINYFIVCDNICENADEKPWENHFEATEEELYWQTKRWANDETLQSEKFVQVYLACKEHSTNAQAWYKRHKQAFIRVQKEHPKLAFASIEGTLAITKIQTRWERFKEFIAQEKTALGLMALSLLTIGLSSR